MQTIKYMAFLELNSIYKEAFLLFHLSGHRSACVPSGGNGVAIGRLNGPDSLHPAAGAFDGQR